MSSEPTFGHVVAEKRKKLNLSQKELAAKIIREDGVPISPQYLSDIERDRRAPTSDHMVGQFALVLDLNADYLHYLNGRFPEDVRKDRLTENEFSERMLAFRKPQNRSKKLMVRYVKDRTGRFPERPHYEPKDLLGQDGSK